MPPSGQAPGSANPVISQTGTQTVRQRVQQLRSDQSALANAISQQQAQLSSTRSAIASETPSYTGLVNGITSRLQSGTTPGNPELVNQWNSAQAKLDAITMGVGTLNSLASQVTTQASVAGYLLENVRATFAVGGAVEEDHRNLRAIESETTALHAADRPADRRPQCRDRPPERLPGPRAHQPRRTVLRREPRPPRHARPARASRSRRGASRCSPRWACPSSWAMFASKHGRNGLSASSLFLGLILGLAAPALAQDCRPPTARPSATSSRARSTLSSATMAPAPSVTPRPRSAACSARPRSSWTWCARATSRSIGPGSSTFARSSTCTARSRRRSMSSVPTEARHRLLSDDAAARRQLAHRRLLPAGARRTPGLIRRRGSRFAQGAGAAGPAHPRLGHQLAAVPDRARRAAGADLPHHVLATAAASC